MAKAVFTANLTGDKALDHALAQFPFKFVNKAVKKEMRQTMKDIVLRDAKRTTPVKTGQLKRSLKVRTAKNRKGGRLERGKIGFAVVAARTSKIDAYYGKWVFLDAHNRPPDALKGSGVGTVRKGTRTLRNALYSNSRAIMATLTSKLKRALPRIAREVRIDSLRYKG